MTDRLRLVFDTSVLVSALIFEHSIPDRVFRTALRQCDVLLSPETLAEADDVLFRRKFDRYLTMDQRREFLEVLAERATFIMPVNHIQASRDPRDDKFLELAVSGKADVLVTGDSDLLVLHPFQGVRILTPSQLLAEL